MNFLEGIWDAIIQFFAIGEMIQIVKTGDYSSFLTIKGVLMVLRVSLPFLLFVEIFRNLVLRKFDLKHYKIPLLSYLFIAILGRIIPLSFVVVLIGFFSKYKLFTIPITWYGFIIAYVVYEFANFVHHYFGHKVRLLWCLHSIHHSSETMNLAVAYNRFFLEQTYIDFVKIGLCIILGIQPPVLLAIFVVDEIWGLFIHIGEDFFPKGRIGILETIIFSPSHHRVHHAKNPLYMDTNFCVTLNLWDRIFKTYQPIKDEIPVDYGITRPVNSTDFVDVTFGEIKSLYKDVSAAPGIKNKLLYLIMPPGWSHDGEDKTASKMRNEFLKKLLVMRKNNI